MPLPATISPTTEASGLSLPSTLHSNSRASWSVVDGIRAVYVHAQDDEQTHSDSHQGQGSHLAALSHQVVILATVCMGLRLVRAS